MKEGSRRAVIAALTANAGITVMKFTGFAFTGAASMLAEAIHSVADTGNQVLLLLGGNRSRRVQTADHPFGFGRERYFWAFIVALVLFLLGSVFAIYHGIHKLRHPEPIQNAGWAIGILLVSMLLEGSAFRTALQEAQKLRGEASWLGFIRHAKSAEIPVILLEDLGAIMGLAMALVCVGLVMWTGNPLWDAVGSLAIGGLLGVIAVVLAVEMHSLLIGEAASPARLARIRTSIEEHSHVQRIIHMRTQHLGPDELLVAAKVQFDPGLGLPELAALIDEVEDDLRDAVPAARIIYLEPDFYAGPSRQG
jgi:cation diffusion facilitator family transporter